MAYYFLLLEIKTLMRYFLLLFFTISGHSLYAQKIDSIYINLYTDSLKKGTFNYINVDGLLSNGSYMPLDSSHIDFKASAGKFEGNSLWVEPGFTGEKISVSVTLKQDRTQQKEIDIYIKQKPDGPLKTVDEIMDDLKRNKKKKS